MQIGKALGMVIVLAIMSAPVGAEGSNQKKLLEFGWDEPDTTFLRSNIVVMGKTPFDGCVFHVDYRKGGGEKGSFTWKAWGEQAFSEADLAEAFADLRAIQFGSFKCNFLRFNTTPAKLDWFDDYSAVLTNATLAARLAKVGGCPGILFDIEQYEGQLFDYRKQRDTGEKSWGTYAARVRDRGAEVMHAFQEGYPGLTVFLTFGYSLPWVESNGGKKPLSECHYGLLAPFLDGMVQAAEDGTRLIDGYELSYGYKTAAQFSEARKVVKQDVVKIVRDLEKYRRVFELGFGIWLDRDWRKRGWDTEDLAKNYFSPETLETSVRAALAASDEYVWIYSETPRWWSAEGAPVKLPAAYGEALEKARASHGERSAELNQMNPGTPWPATDALGRRVPTHDEVGPPKPDRRVGIFYFLWHNETGARSPFWDGPYDVSRILAKDPDALEKPNSPLWGPIGSMHYWGEPLYGYYRSTDEWVLRRHAWLLADAGIDTLIFDTTNARSYPDVYMELCRVFQKVRQEGGRTPQIVFMVNTRAAETAQEIYEALYKPGLYPELWFRWKGKPLMICDPAVATPELRQFFTLRRAHWPFTLTNTPMAWHWEATYPQPYGFDDDPQKAEEVNVSVAQNLRQADGKVTNMSAGNARGRSFHDGKEDESRGAVNWGYNFQEQWKRAFELQPPFVMVTGWNEWIAGRWGKPDGPPVFVDQYSEEFSRDIEPMKGGHTDDYYYQLVANVRRFKGAPPLPRASAPMTIRMDSGFEQWREVGPEFQDHVGETVGRDSDGVAGLHYKNATGRNDFVALKVARDERNVYFYARTRETITPASTNWMWLLIDRDQNPKTGWEGYDFIVNRELGSGGGTWLEKNEDGWHWKKVVLLHFQVKGNELAVAVPRNALGLREGSTQTALDFKWADNLQHTGDVMDFYISGDVAPEGRFNYRFEGE